jgi:hypothetical protein
MIAAGLERKTDIAAHVRKVRAMSKTYVNGDPENAALMIGLAETEIVNAEQLRRVGPGVDRAKPGPRG